MNEFTQYTVYVSKDTPPTKQTDIDWAEIAYRLKHSKKVFLISGTISFLGGFIYLMFSIFSFVDSTALVYKICVWMLVSYILFWLSTKGIEPYKTSIEEANESHSTHKTVTADEIKASLLKLGIEVKSTKNLLEILEADDIELFNATKQVTKHLLFPPSEIKAAAIEKLFSAIHYSYTEKCSYIDNHEKITIETGQKNLTFEPSYYNQVISGNYPSANQYLSWLANNNK